MKPRLITERELIRGVARRWAEQYGPRWDRHDAHKREIYDRLLKLDPETCSAADVAAIIGNSSWTHIGCNGCGNDVTSAVEVGAPRDYDSSTATLCADCVREALAAFGGRP